MRKTSFCSTGIFGNFFCWRKNFVLVCKREFLLALITITIYYYYYSHYYVIMFGNLIVSAIKAEGIRSSEEAERRHAHRTDEQPPRRRYLLVSSGELAARRAVCCASLSPCSRWTCTDPGTDALLPCRRRRWRRVRCDHPAASERSDASSAS